MEKAEGESFRKALKNRKWEFDQREKQLRDDYVKLMDKYQKLQIKKKNSQFDTIKMSFKQRAFTMIERPSLEDTSFGNLEDEMDEDLFEILSQNEPTMRLRQMRSEQQNL